jgi:hypothetical protein
LYPATPTNLTIDYKQIINEKGIGVYGENGEKRGHMREKKLKFCQSNKILGAAAEFSGHLLVINILKLIVK